MRVRTLRALMSRALVPIFNYDAVVIVYIGCSSYKHHRVRRLSFFGSPARTGFERGERVMPFQVAGIRENFG